MRHAAHSFLVAFMLVEHNSVIISRDNGFDEYNIWEDRREYSSGADLLSVLCRRYTIMLPKDPTEITSVRQPARLRDFIKGKVCGFKHHTGVV